MNRIDNRKFKLTIGTLIVSIVLLLIAVGLISYIAGDIPNAEIRANILTSFILSLFNWWGLLIMGLLGFYHGANVTQKWLTKGSDGGNRDGILRRRETEDTIQSNDIGGYDIQDIQYVGERSVPSRSPANRVSSAKGDNRSRNKGFVARKSGSGTSGTGSDPAIG